MAFKWKRNIFNPGVRNAKIAKKRSSFLIFHYYIVFHLEQCGEERVRGWNEPPNSTWQLVSCHITPVGLCNYRVGISQLKQHDSRPSRIVVITNTPPGRYRSDKSVFIVFWQTNFLYFINFLTGKLLLKHLCTSYVERMRRNRRNKKWNA